MSNPIYYRNLLYSESEREDLWIEKLDKEERWIHDVKIDMKQKNAEDYVFKVLEEKRELNKVCGFGDGSIDFDVRFYKRQQRMLAKMNRIAKVNKGYN